MTEFIASLIAIAIIFAIGAAILYGASYVVTSGACAALVSC